MTKQMLIETRPSTLLVKELSPMLPVGSRLGPLFASIAALICSSLEIESLEQIDSLSKYMTYGQIALDASVALLVLLGLTAVGWLGILLLKGTASLIPWASLHRESLVWRLGLILPFSYFALDVFGAVRLQLFSKWYPGLWGWVGISVAIVGACVAGLSLASLSVLQEFCRTRLAPIGWFHVALALIGGVALWAHGVYLFHDYAHAGKQVVASDLPDIYLITFDAFRADETSLYGYSRPTTPNLERFAQRSYTFDYCFANANFTTAATTSIETGKLPWSHHVFQFFGFLQEHREENLAALLQQRGYYTAMISSNYAAAPFEHRTLDSYDAVEYAAPTNSLGTWLRYTNLIGLNAQQTLSGPLLTRLAGVRFYLDYVIWNSRYAARAKPVFDRARALLERPDITQPRFVWTHILPAHDPYLAPAPYQKRFLPGNKLTRNYNFLGLRNYTLPPGVSAAELRARYDEVVSYADQVVGDYLDWLDQTGRLDRSIIIISADHGESFEHNRYLHTGPELYNSLIRVPLLIHLPGQKQGARVSQPAQEADLLPTLIDLTGGRAPSWTDGVSLKPALEGKPLPKRLIFSMDLEPDRIFDPIAKGTVAVMDGEFKYVNYLDRGEQQLYRYRTDEFDDHDLIGSEPEVAKRMHDLLFNELREVNERPTPQP